MTDAPTLPAAKARAMHRLGVSSDALRKAVGSDPFWQGYLELALKQRAVAMHLVVFGEPFFSWVVNGQKTVDSRFTVHNIAPFERVDSGDVLLLKKAGEPITALCRAGDVWYYRLSPGVWHEIRSRFAQALCLTGSNGTEFLSSRANASYATLIRLDRVFPVTPIRVRKRDRRGWVVLTTRSNPAPVENRIVADEQAPLSLFPML